VHLVGHDWGSVQSWEFATAPRSRDRIASFTSISGPALDHVARWVRTRARRPTPRNLARLVGQASRSWYVAGMQLPGAVERVWGLPTTPAQFAEFVHRSERVPEGFGHPASTLAEDGANGAKLYRRNVGRRMVAPREDAVAPMPVLLIVPTEDRYLSPHVYDDLDRWAPNLRRRHLASHHWAPLEQPEPVAEWIAELVDDVEASGTPPDPRISAGRSR
jgi:pimeloyl-ACP methyl ester carboxylesterase